MMRIALLVCAVFCMAAASDPADRLPDPASEARARALFQEVRCLVCQNESIDDSDAELAADLRKVVREKIAGGMSDAQVRSFLVDRYGEFVLLKPTFSAANLILWLAPLAVILLGLGLLFARTRQARPAEALSPEEEARLAELSQIRPD
jgi:cytochrome c-type biogenesis protein CcmH